MSAERQLLFAVLAFESELLDLAQLTSACREWAEDKSKLLSDLLVERGWLTPKNREFIDELVDRKLAKHQHDSRVTLNSVVRGDVCDAIQQVDDSDIRQSLGQWPASDLRLIETMVETPLSPDELLARYSWIKEIAKGGLGRVWLARDNHLAREVALKELRPERAEALGNQAVRRLLKEAQITGQLQHPNIVPVYEMHRGSRPFYVMKLVKGETLTKAIRRHHQQRRDGRRDPLSLPHLLNAFVKICDALEYAHSRGIIHRDLKPDNISLGDYGEVIVLDWGLAKLVGSLEVETEPVQLTEDALSPPSQAGANLGTLHYMSPEQARGQVELLDRQTDIYGLGTILFEILTDRPPHGPPTPVADKTYIPTLLEQIATSDTPRARDHEPSVSPALDAICAQAMASQKSERYGTVEQLARDVQRFLADEPVSAWQEPLASRTQRQKRQHLKSERDLSTSYCNLGDMQRQSGQVTEALASYQQGLEICQKLAAANPGDARAQRDLSIAYEKLGNVQLQSGQATEARGSYQKMHESYLKLAAADPRDVRTQRDLSVSYEKLGDVQRQSGQAAEARGSYQQGLAIRQKLAATDPSDSRALRDLSVAYNKLGNVQLHSGQVTEALGSYQQGLEISQKLAAADASDSQALRDLSISYNKLGNLQLQSGKGTEALWSFQQDLKISQKLAAADPSDAQAQSDLVVSFYKLGATNQQLKVHAEAIIWFQQALDILERLEKEGRLPPTQKERIALAKAAIKESQKHLP